MTCSKEENSEISTNCQEWIDRNDNGLPFLKQNQENLLSEKKQLPVDAEYRKWNGGTLHIPQSSVSMELLDASSFLIHILMYADSPPTRVAKGLSRMSMCLSR